MLKSPIFFFFFFFFFYQVLISLALIALSDGVPVLLRHGNVVLFHKSIYEIVLTLEH